MISRDLARDGFALGLIMDADGTNGQANKITGRVSITEPFMIRLTVLYGHPDDPAEFDRYYQEVHIPIARKMQGLQGWTIGKCQSAKADEKPAFYMIVGLYAESREAMEAILASPAGRATVTDVANFATGGATFLYDEQEVMIPLSLS